MKKRLDISYLKHFYHYARPYQATTLLGLAMMPLSITANLLFPWLIIQVIDKQLALGQFDGLPRLIVAMALVLVVNYVADAVYSYCLRKTGQYAIFDMRSAMLRRIMRLPRTYFDRTPAGITLSRLTSDLEAIGESFVLGILGLLRDSLNTIAIIIMMLLIDWQLTLVVLLVFPPVLWLTNVIRRRMRALYLLTRSSLAKGTGFLQECLLGVKTVQLYGAEREVEARYLGYTTEFRQAQMKTNAWDAMLFSVITGVTSVTVGLLIWYGSGQIMQGLVTLGVLIAFINMLEKLFVPLRDFTGQLTSIQRSFAAFEHIDELFTEPLEEADQPLVAPESLAGKLDRFESLEFRDVTFRYKPESEPVLCNVSFTLRRGEHLALVGTTGSGKSTIIRLLNKIYVNYEGSILLNGMELATLPRDQVLHLLSLMQQDVYLFEQSIHFNIALGKPDITAHQVEQAARYVYAHHFIEQLPGRYQFMLSQNGDNLSAGQVQLLSFARAVAQGGDVMMLDEATSSVDSVTESLIQKAISKLFRQKTVIAIAHRLSTIRHSDQILVLDQGRIIERGNHEQLLARNGVYAGLLKESHHSDA